MSELRGDLDWIVTKALEKVRAHRYEIPYGLAMDAERRLNNEPEQETSGSLALVPGGKKGDQSIVAAGLETKPLVLGKNPACKGLASTARIEVYLTGTDHGSWRAKIGYSPYGGIEHIDRAFGKASIGFSFRTRSR